MRTSLKNSGPRLPHVLAAAAAVWLAASPAHSQESPADAQEMSTQQIVDGLRSGGYVIVMRHATAAESPPSPREQAPGNVDGERQLNEDGRAQMTAFGYAFRELSLPVAQTLTSPVFRAVESAEYFGIGEASEVEALAPPDSGGDAAFLASNVTEAPAEGQNRVVITQRANIVEAFGEQYGISVVEDGESLIFMPTGDDGAELVGRMTIKQWATAAVN